MARPPKPSALKLVTGTLRGSRRNAHEPEPALLIDLEPPAHLAERSAAVWREVAPMLRRMQVLTEADVISLEMLCDAVADYRHARAVCGEGFVATSGKGSQMLNQWLVAKQLSGKRAEAWMSRFGMDPVSRARVMVNPQGDMFDSKAATGTGRFFT